MKTSVLSTLAMLSLSAALGPVQLMAQAPTNTTIQVTIPFDFSVGAKAFPAGDYIVQQMVPSVLEIQSADGRAKTLMTTHAAQPSSQHPAELTFNRYGNRYFLSQVSSSDKGWELSKSAVEKEVLAKRTEQKPVSIVASTLK